MVSYIDSASAAWDVENSWHVVQCSVRKFTDGIGWVTRVDYLYSRPNGNWTNVEFEPGTMTYHDFLGGFMQQDLDVLRKKCRLVTELMNTWGNHYKVVKFLSTLDPTFTPPSINRRCKWQIDMVQDIASRTAFYVIETCTNTVRLRQFYLRVMSSMA